MNPASDIPVINTPRLMLTVPTPDEAPRLLRYAADNKTHLSPWEPIRPDEYYTLDFWANEAASCIEEFRQGRSLLLVLLDRGDPSGPVHGQCAFSHIVRGPLQAAYLGYSLDYRAVGRGLMSEALTAAIRYAFDELNLHRIMANYMPTNERSGRLLRRLGFTVEGYARDYVLVAGKWQDNILTSLVNASWRGA
jgi:[ribosomal protein S5]-alanine N-acetyltransferase